MHDKRGMRHEGHTFFQTDSWNLNDGCTVLDLSNEHEEMGYYVMLGSYLVANSEREWKEHKWPRAQYYIALENESDTLKYKKNEIKTKAFGKLASSDLTDVYKRKLVTLLGLATSKAAVTAEQVNNLLFEYVDKSTFTPGSNIDKFNEMSNLLNTPNGREEFEARWILAQAQDYRIIYEKQGTYTWVRPSGKLVIGERTAEAIDFILNPKKSSEVEELLKEIQVAIKKEKRIKKKKSQH